MPRQRRVIEVRRVKRSNDDRVWTCGVPGCDISHADSNALEDHLGEDEEKGGHSALCLVTDFMWLNTRGDDVPCPSSSNTSVIQVLDADSSTEAYKRVSTVVSLQLQAF